MKYQSKKDETIVASFVSEDEKCKTTMLCYETGEKKGLAFSVTNSTLKRWWKKIESGEDSLENTSDKSVLDKVDMEMVNTPYPEPKEQKYVPVPDAVKEYEENKRRRHGYNSTFPETYEEIADNLAKEDIKIKGVNKGYISLPDNSKIKRISKGLGILASQELWEGLMNLGFSSKPCIEKGTPARIDILTNDDYDKLVGVLKSLYKNENTEEE